MKILLVNRNFYLSGGPERYMFTLIKSMSQHQFIPFCVKFDKNEPSAYDRFFIDPPGGGDNVFFQDYHMPASQKMLYGLKKIYWVEAKKKLEKLIRYTKPDVALFLNAVYFSDSIIDACVKYNVPIIWRLSDFHKLCASYLLFRDGQICEACLEKSLIHAVRNRCGGYQHSLGAALIKAAGMKMSRTRKLYDKVNFFITPSNFTRKKMIQGGFTEKKVIWLPTFCEMPESVTPPEKRDEILYVGRISPEKGIETLIEAFTLLKKKTARLTIVGGIDTAYARKLVRTKTTDCKNTLRFVGHKSKSEVNNYFKRCTFFVVPSIWYENQPNVVLEGMSHGRAAVVSKIGSLLEVVQNGVNGFHFVPGSASDLASVLEKMLDNFGRCRKMGDAAFQYVKRHHHKDQHTRQLEALMKAVFKRGLKNRSATSMWHN